MWYIVTFSAKHSLDSILGLLEIVGRHALRCMGWCSDHERSTRTGEACTSRKRKPGLVTRTRINVNVASGWPKNDRTRTWLDLI